MKSSENTHILMVSSMFFTTILSIALFLATVSSVPISSNEYDLSNFQIGTSCSGDYVPLGTIVSGTEKVRFKTTCKTENGITTCSYVQNYNLVNVKIVYFDGLKGNLVGSGSTVGSYSPDVELSNAHYVSHSVLIESGRGVVEHITLNQKCFHYVDEFGNLVDGCEKPNFEKTVCK